MFVENLTKEAYKNIDRGNTLRYKDLSKYVQDNQHLEFLLQIVPQKIKVKNFKEIIENGDSSSDSMSDSEDDN